MKIGPKLTLDHLDAFDRRILDQVQRDNQQSHAAIGEQVGLSASAVRKRLSALRKSGIIAADVAVLRDDPAFIQVIVTVTLEKVTTEAHESIQDLVQRTPEITQAYHVAGREDFIFILRCPSLSWYEAWSMEAFVSNPIVGVFDTRVVWSCMRYSTVTPLSTQAE